MDQSMAFDIASTTALCIAGVIGALIFEIMKHFTIKFVDAKFPGFLGRKNPLKSSFFNKMQILIFYKVNRLGIWCPLRQRIFKKLLRICFETWNTRAREKAIDPAVDRLNSEEYENFWKNFVYKTTDTWEAKVIQEGIPEVAVTKYREIHNKTLAIIIGIIEQICGSVKVYASNTEKTIAILDFIAILLDMALIDAEVTVMEINGELSDVTFEGTTCQQCEKECVHRVEPHN